MMNEIKFYGLTLSALNGAVCSFRPGDTELLRPARELFSLQLLDPERNPHRVRSSDFSMPRCSDALMLTFSGATAVPGLGVKVHLRGGEADGGVSFRFEVEGVKDGWRLEWIDGPQLVIGSGQTLFQPIAEGVLITDFSTRLGNPYDWYHELGFPVRGRAVGALYPGFAQMQFLAAWNRDGDGIYFGADDAAHTPKAVEYEPLDHGDSARLSLQTFCGDGDPDGYRSSFDYRLIPFRGDWKTACEIYRNWIKTLPEFQEKPVRPAWMRDSPVTLIYPVRGNGDDRGKQLPNEYFPYVNALTAVDFYAAKLDSRVLALPMHWEGTAPWAPPYVWPPYGGEEKLALFRDRLHERGHLLGVYCSGTAWTQTSSITDYSQEESFATEQLEKQMMRGPKGEIDAVVCNGENLQRLGYDMCVAQEWTRKTVLDEFEKLAKFRFDYVQFFDQNLGGGSLLCYAREHRHPDIPGAWQTGAMASLQEEMVALAGVSTAIGTEAGAATPYVKTLFYNDSRPGFVYGWGLPVPGYAYVFHEYACNFMGNQCGILMDPLETPWNLLFRTAYAFHCGDMLSILLGPGGTIFWNWGMRWNSAAPPAQEPELRMLRDLNALRKRYPQFLFDGKMIPEFIRWETGKIPLVLPNRTEEIDRVLSSAWEDSAGNRIEFITNFLTDPCEIILEGTEKRRLAGLETLVLNPENKIEELIHDISRQEP